MRVAWVTGSHKLLRSEAVVGMPNDPLTVTIESVVIEVLLLLLLREALHMLLRWLMIVELVLLRRHYIALWWSHMVVLRLTMQRYL